MLYNAFFRTKHCREVLGFISLMKNNGLIFDSSVYRYKRSFLELFIIDIRTCLRIRILVEITRDKSDKDLLIRIWLDEVGGGRVATYAGNAIQVWNTSCEGNVHTDWKLIERKIAYYVWFSINELGWFDCSSRLMGNLILASGFYSQL